MDEAKRLYDINFVNIGNIRNMDAVILAVAHKEFIDLSKSDIDIFFGKGVKVLIDIKGICNGKEYFSSGYRYWRL